MDEICLAKWLWNVLASNNPEQEIDSKLIGNRFEHEMLSILKIACFCTVDDPSDRPSSKDVRCMLSQTKDEIHESRPSTRSSLELSKTILREGKGKLLGNGNSIRIKENPWLGVCSVRFGWFCRCMAKRNRIFWFVKFPTETDRNG